MYVLIQVIYVSVEEGGTITYELRVTDVKFAEDRITLIRFGEEVQYIPTANLCELHIKPML